jgi:hypothetical protein
VQCGKACGAEEFDTGQIQCEPLGAIGVAQCVVDEFLGIGCVQFTVGGDHRQ